MKASRLNARAACDTQISPMNALAAPLSSPPVTAFFSPTTPSPQAAAGAPKYAGAEDTRGVLRAGGNGGEATATATAANADEGLAFWGNHNQDTAQGPTKFYAVRSGKQPGVYRVTFDEESGPREDQTPCRHEIMTNVPWLASLLRDASKAHLG